jgi:CspA family cold shock protein
VPEEGQTATGTVKWFNRTRGFGYITPDDGGPDVFVQHTAITAKLSDGFRVLTEGARVEFVTREGESGTEAVRVSAYGS